MNRPPDHFLHSFRALCCSFLSQALANLPDTHQAAKGEKRQPPLTDLPPPLSTPSLQERLLGPGAHGDASRSPTPRLLRAKPLAPRGVGAPAEALQAARVWSANQLSFGTRSSLLPPPSSPSPESQNRTFCFSSPRKRGRGEAGLEVRSCPFPFREEDGRGRGGFAREAELLAAWALWDPGLQLPWVSGRTAFHPPERGRRLREWGRGKQALSLQGLQIHVPLTHPEGCACKLSLASGGSEKGRAGETAKCADTLFSGFPLLASPSPNFSYFFNPRLSLSLFFLSPNSRDYKLNFLWQLLAFTVWLPD